MNDNPYQSPKSAYEVEKRPEKRPNRYFHALVCGFFAFVALFNSLGLGLVMPFGSAPPYMLLLFLLVIPVTFGLVVAIWAWRYSESKWVFPVVVLLGLTSLMPFLVGIFFFGFR